VGDAVGKGIPEIKREDVCRVEYGARDAGSVKIEPPLAVMVWITVVTAVPVGYGAVALEALVAAASTIVLEMVGARE
jgi:hypothetical protein